MVEELLCAFVSHVGSHKSTEGIILIKEQPGQVEHTVIVDGMIESNLSLFA